LDGWKRAAFLAKPEKHFSATCVWSTHFRVRRSVNDEWAANLFPRSPPPVFAPPLLPFRFSPVEVKESPNPQPDRRTPMPLTPATLSRSKKFSPAPAAFLPTQPAPHPPTDSAPPVSEIGDRRFPHAPALSQFVLVKRTPAWDRVSGWVQSRSSGVRKDLSPSVLVNSAWGLWRSSAGSSALGLVAREALSHSVLVKRVVQVLVHCAPAFELRLAVECCPENGSAKRVLGLGWAVTGLVRQARRIVLVESFSSPCNAPLPTFCDPGAGSDLRDWGASHA